MPPQPATSSSPEAFCSVEATEGRVEVVMRGLLTAEALDRGPQDLAEHLRRESAEVVFDVRDLEAYERAVRLRWQAAVWPQRHRIRSLTVLSTSQLTRMGALMFARFLGVECRVLSR